MIAENKRTGNQVIFTLDQWRNLEKTGHARSWTIIDAEIVPKPEIVEFQQFSRPTELEIEYHLNYRKLLDESGIKYDKRIRSQAKLKEIYELNNKL